MVQDIVDQRLGRHEELGHRVVGVRFAAPSMTECKMSSKVLTIEQDVPFYSCNETLQCVCIRLMFPVVISESNVPISHCGCAP